MYRSLKNNVIYLILYFSLTLLICFLVEILLFEWGAIQNYKSKQMIFATVWILVLFVILYFVIKKTGIVPTIFFSFSLVYGTIFYLIGLLLAILFGSYNTIIIDRSYVGTSGTTEIINTDRDGTNTHYLNTFVFKKNDKLLNQELNKLDEEFSEGSTEEEFIFWQTALAKGFEPKNISEYDCCSGFKQKMYLYLTVGPITILESLIKATTPALFLLIIPLIGFLFNKRLFFDDTEGLRKIFKMLQK